MVECAFPYFLDTIRKDHLIILQDSPIEFPAAECVRSDFLDTVNNIGLSSTDYQSMRGFLDNGVTS